MALNGKVKALIFQYLHHIVSNSLTTWLNPNPPGHKQTLLYFQVFQQLCNVYMWAAVGSSLVGAQSALQTLACLVQGWKDASGVRRRVFSTRAQKYFVDLPFNLSREDGGKHGADTLQHAFPQDRVATHKVQYEYAWSNGRER